LRRFIPSLVVAFGLLALGAVAIVIWQGGGGLGPDSSQSTLLIMVGGVLAGLVVILVLGAGLGWAVNGLAALVSGERKPKPAKATAVAVAPPAVAPAPAKKAAETPTVWLSDARSQMYFWGATIVLVLGFLVVRALAAGSPPGYPLDRLPDLNTTLFELPVANLPVTEAVALGAVVLAVLVSTVIAGWVIAQITVLFARQAQQAAGGAGADKAKSAPAPKPAAEQPKIFLYDRRSLLIFSITAVILIGAFLGVRAWAAAVPLGYTPFDRIANVTVFTLPGEKIAGWPSQIVPGPGDEATALQTAVLVILVTLGGVGVVGFGLARLLEAFSTTKATVQQAKTPGWGAQELTQLEAAVQKGLARPFPPRLNGLDQVIVVIFLGILALLAVWVVPGIGQALDTDRAIEATRVAASWTPTPTAGPVVTLAELVAELPAGDAAAGKTATETRGCVACHIAADPSAALVGSPWLAAQSKDGLGVSEHAASRPGEASYTGRAENATEYLYESITNPSAYLVAGFQPNIMPANYGQTLPPQELADIIAYLTTLK